MTDYDEALRLYVDREVDTAIAGSSGLEPYYSLMDSISVTARSAVGVEHSVWDSVMESVSHLTELSRRR